MSHNLSRVSQKRSHLMFFAVALLLGIVLVAFTIPTVSAQKHVLMKDGSDNFCVAREQPQFRFGFAAFKQRMGAAVGEAVECEHYDEQE